MPLSSTVCRLPFYALTALLDSVDWNLKEWKNVESFYAFAHMSRHYHLGTLSPIIENEGLYLIYVPYFLGGRIGRILPSI